MILKVKNPGMDKSIQGKCKLRTANSINFVLDLYDKVRCWQEGVKYNKESLIYAEGQNSHSIVTNAYQ